MTYHTVALIGVGWIKRDICLPGLNHPVKCNDLINTSLAIHADILCIGGTCIQQHVSYLV